MRGLPFVTCTDDPDIPEGFPGKYTVGLTDEAVSIHDLIHFVKEQNTNTTEYMHEYACQQLTWDHKIEKFIRYEFPNK